MACKLLDNPSAIRDEVALVTSAISVDSAAISNHVMYVRDQVQDFPPKGGVFRANCEKMSAFAGALRKFNEAKAGDRSKERINTIVLKRSR